jgi:4a-hydroxytetrahydrobiopterin dehydratase
MTTTRPQALDAAAWQALAAELPHWRYDADRGGVISREFRFADFVQAFAFMTRLALVAERMDHHPEWSNVYDRVRISLTTHSARGLTQLDVAFAREADRAASSAQAAA